MKMKRTQRPEGKGPFRADDLGPDGRYELSDGHPIYCAPSGGRGGTNTGAGYEVIDPGPAVAAAGVDTGFSPNPGTLRAPDVAVGAIPDAPGWVPGAPTLAL